MSDEAKMYCAALLDAQSSDLIKKYCEANSIPNYNKDFHITIVYSDVVVSFDPLSDCGVKIPSYNIIPTKWKTRDNVTIIVLTLNSKWLDYRFREAKEAGATWDHPEYRPHITLSYDVPDDFDLSSLGNIDFDLYIENEYCEYT